MPIMASRVDPQALETLAVTVAGRHDHYGDFGTKNTDQFGAEWRPAETLLVRATYAEAFKAPSLSDLYTLQTSFVATFTDPLTGKSGPAELTSGGNPGLRPETGQSHTLGIVYSSN